MAGDAVWNAVELTFWLAIIAVFAARGIGATPTERLNEVRVRTFCIGMILVTSLLMFGTAAAAYSLYGAGQYFLMLVDTLCLAAQMWLISIQWWILAYKLPAQT